MVLRFLAFCLIQLLLAGVPARGDEDAARVVAELIGAPVFAVGGIEVGEVAEVFLDQEGIPERIRISTDTRLGLGNRTIELSRDVFIALRGAIVVELSVESLGQLPAVSE